MMKREDWISFTTPVSARFWLIDCQTPRDAACMAKEVYNQAIAVPYMAKFVVFARRPYPVEGQLRYIRLYCSDQGHFFLSGFLRTPNPDPDIFENLTGIMTDERFPKFANHKHNQFGTNDSSRSSATIFNGIGGIDANDGTSSEATNRQQQNNDE
ncbi:hypothetical protein niasHS_006180 [Heterodera schachtii]|uniref:Ankyrin UPA domain-containing protein n=1 Tax=Heterodera schachtii TaxID=97005 RepID=A0ABD2JSB8_HETSC